MEGIQAREEFGIMGVPGAGWCFHLQKVILNSDDNFFTQYAYEFIVNNCQTFIVKFVFSIREKNQTFFKS